MRYIVRYKGIRALRLWKCDAAGDESVRAVCQYLDTRLSAEEAGGGKPSDRVPPIIELQVMDCNLTALGCEFLGTPSFHGEQSL